jgi:hypothetical protein
MSHEKSFVRQMIFPDFLINVATMGAAISACWAVLLFIRK